MQSQWAKLAGFIVGYRATCIADVGLKAGPFRAIADAGDGINDADIADRLDLDRRFVRLWCRRRPPGTRRCPLVAVTTVRPRPERLVMLASDSWTLLSGAGDDATHRPALVPIGGPAPLAGEQHVELGTVGGPQDVGGLVDGEVVAQPAGVAEIGGERAHVVGATPADLDAALYGRIKQGLGDEPPKGMISHVALELAGAGLRYIDVWESEQDWDRFAEERLHPVVHQLLAEVFGDETPPEPDRVVMPVVDVWLGR